MRRMPSFKGRNNKKRMELSKMRTNGLIVFLWFLDKLVMLGLFVWSKYWIG